VGKINSLHNLENLRKKIQGKAEGEKGKPLITVCNGTGCHASGCVEVTEALRQEIATQNLTDKVNIKTTGCHGFCERGPIVIIQPGDVFYQKVDIKDIPQIIKHTVIDGRIVD